jgi:MFS family permease
VPGVQIIVVAAVLLIILFFNRRHLLSHEEIIHSGSGLKLPSLSILSISFICMVVFMAEGCVADWSALYLKESLHAPKEIISLGYASFAIAMTIGRFNGDVLISKTGSKRIVIAGCLLASLGFVFVVFAPVITVSLIGYICIGFGCSCIVPVLFSASATIPGVSKVEGFAMVTTGGLIGFLAGPSLIGMISEKINLSTGLSLLIVLTLSAAFIGWRNKFLTNKKIAVPEMGFDEQLY